MITPPLSPATSTFTPKRARTPSPDRPIRRLQRAVSPSPSLSSSSAGEALPLRLRAAPLGLGGLFRTTRGCCNFCPGAAAVVPSLGAPVVMLPLQGLVGREMIGGRSRAMELRDYCNPMQLSRTKYQLKTTAQNQVSLLHLGPYSMEKAPQNPLVCLSPSLYVQGTAKR